MAILFGTNNNDTISGTSSADLIYGFGGNDSLGGSSGSDTIYGGDGNDTIRSSGGGYYSGDNGNDYIYAGLGVAETLRGGDGVDWLDGTTFNGNYAINLATGVTNFAGESFTQFEHVVTGSGNDTLTGTSDTNWMYSGDGNDWVDGGFGSDYLYGGAGNDSLIGGGGTDTVYGGEGNDTIRSSGGYYSGDNGNDYIYAGLGVAETLRGGDGVDWLDGTTFNGNYAINLATGVTNFAGESFTQFEHVVTGSGNDTLTGTSDTNWMYGGDGNDWIDGGLGNDYLSGGAGNDSLIGGGGSDTVYGGEGNDTIRSSGGGYYDGQNGNDYIYAGLGVAETLRGGDGVDWLDGTTFNGNYAINLSTGVTNFSGESFTQFEHVVTGSGNDTLTGTSDTNWMYGGDGNDWIDGGLGNDYISGGAGNDSLIGGGGSDTVYGGEGNDTIRSSGGGYYDGQNGNDYIYAGLGVAETLRGGDGVDWLNGTTFNGDYAINLTSGATNFAGESFTMFENVVTGAGNDTLTGTVDANRMFGGAGNDIIYGGGGNDYLAGGLGNDRLVGGSGADQMFGGGGNDVFVFTSPSQSSISSGYDRIYGFAGAGISLGEENDRINLSAIDANTSVAGNQAFIFNGTTAGGAGRIWLADVGNETWLRVNTDNDAAAEMTIRITDGLDSASDYWRGDFVL